MEKILVFAREDERFKDRYIYACTVMGYEPVRAYTEADPEDFAGVIMIGGPDVDPALYDEENTASRYVNIEYDRACLDMIGKCFEKGIPLLGICRGLQIINVYFGGSLYQDIENHMIDGGMHETFGLQGSDIIYPFPEKMVTNTRHHQAVKVLGQGLKLTAEAYDGTPEAFEHENGRVLAVQWHPERMLDNMPGEGGDGILVFDRFKEMISRCGRNHKQ